MNRRNYVEGTSINNLLAKTPKTNTSGYKNVYYVAPGKYRAAIYFKGIQYHLGTYADLAVAHAAVMEFREEVINPFLLDKMVGIREEEGGYRTFFGGVDLGVFDTIEEANKARIRASTRRMTSQNKESKHKAANCPARK